MTHTPHALPTHKKYAPCHPFTEIPAGQHLQAPPSPWFRPLYDLLGSWVAARTGKLQSCPSEVLFEATVKASACAVDKAVEAAGRRDSRPKSLAHIRGKRQLGRVCTTVCPALTGLAQLSQRMKIG
eukprot:1157270-Pelagomonas_calceolata.AAC.8